MGVWKARWRRWHYKAENGKEESIGGMATSRKKAIRLAEQAADRL